MKYYFLGQDNFGNRGCEALIKSTVKLLRESDPAAVFFVPSTDITRDSKQWPDHRELNVNFCHAEPFPASVKWWGRLQRRLYFFKTVRPIFTPSNYTAQLIKDVDVVIMTGGDIISLDYGLESLYFWLGLCSFAWSNKKKVVLSAASVGPFTKEPLIERKMSRLLKRFSLITVREQASQHYLQGLAVGTCLVVGDPAFCLDAVRPLNMHEIQEHEGALGLNISPLIEKFKAKGQDEQHIRHQVALFVKHITETTSLRVSLISHVDPLDQTGGYNSDFEYMTQLWNTIVSLGVPEARVLMVQQGLNSQELKYILGKYKYFIGARTHATVGSLSQSVPTISIAYSIKAKGINHQILGTDQYVLETPKVSLDSLIVYFERLQKNEIAIREHLQRRIPEIKLMSRKNAQLIAEISKSGAMQ